MVTVETVLNEFNKIVNFFGNYGNAVQIGMAEIYTKIPVTIPEGWEPEWVNGKINNWAGTPQGTWTYADGWLTRNEV